jgi:hypothetical protein
MSRITSRAAIARASDLLHRPLCDRAAQAMGELFTTRTALDVSHSYSGAARVLPLSTSGE